MSGLAEDVTERRLLATQLAQAQKLEAMGQLAAGIAHEINSPIQYVTDNTRFIQEGAESLIKLLHEHDQLLEGAEVNPKLQAGLKAATEQADLEYLSEEIPAAIQQSLEGLGRVVEIVRAMKEFAHPDSKQKAPTDLGEALETDLADARGHAAGLHRVAIGFGVFALNPGIAGDALF